ncbi:MAG TPA: XrtA system polysaccharide chain length determinant [Burkholderiales bacterium]
MNVPIAYVARILLGEALRWRYLVVAAFATIAVTFVFVGFHWPKNYSASATIYVEERNIIQPLMQGTAVATTSTDRAKIARELIFSRRILDPVLQQAGWLANSPSRLDSERTMEYVKKHTRVTNVGANLVKIEFEDSDPQRAYSTAQQFADLFIEQSSAAQTRESADAFEFIDSQVKIYHQKLTQAEQALKDFRTTHVDARPGTEVEVTRKITELRGGIEKTTLAIKEARIKKSSLESQLSGEAVLATSVTREGQYIARIAELQNQLDTLRLSYLDTYPDVIRLRHQIEELRGSVKTERQKREATSSSVASDDQSSVDETVRVNPIYQKLRTELLDTNTNIQTLAARLEETKLLLSTEIARAQKLYGGEAMLAELTRDYEVNRDIYHDLLKRRENARVSKNLDTNQQGLTMRIQEAATLPVQPSGLRFMHFAIAGVLLGALLPLGVLVALGQVDPRFRVPALVWERTGVPVLAAVPALMTPNQSVRLGRSLNLLAGVVLLTLAVVAVSGVLKLTGGS